MNNEITTEQLNNALIQLLELVRDLKDKVEELEQRLQLTEEGE